MELVGWWRVFLLFRLVATVTKLRRCVDEFDLNVFSSHGIGGMVEGLSQGDGPLFAPRNRPFYHQEVLADDPVAGEGTQGCDELLSWVCLRHGVVVGLSLAVL